MSILSEQINAIKYVGKFLDDLRFGSRMKKADLVEKIRALTRHYPGEAELSLWHKWLIKCKGHE